MKIRFAHLADGLMLALMVAAGMVLLPPTAMAQQRLGYPAGRGSYMRYCAVCHGTDGKGDGPYAPLLTKKPADLTMLSKDNNGVVPAPRVTQVLTFGTNTNPSPYPAHGTRDMPVWGKHFGGKSYAAGSNPHSTIASERVQLLLTYLNHIQQK
jgi:mono/diheme cytochrome c family protein